VPISVLFLFRAQKRSVLIVAQTPPDRKLPALYVLDSVVKNVGTPYTLFLGRNLYSIFMNAYSLVNNQVRKKLDEMLKTWKEPVPGSLELKPVFLPEITRPIENALIKARTAAVQQQQQQQSRNQQEMMRAWPMAMPNPQWRSTPTPPQANGQYHPPPPQAFAPQNAPNTHFQVCYISSLCRVSIDTQSQPRPPYPPQPQYSHAQPNPQHFQQPYLQPTSYPQTPLPSQSFDPLNRDIADLIAKFRNEFGANPYDDALRNRLKALVDLQGIMSRQQLAPQELQAVRDQVAQLSASSARAPAPQQYVPPPQHTYQQPRHLHQLPPQESTPQTGDLQGLLSSRNLADIIAKAQRTPSSTPVSQAPVSHPQQIPTSRPPGPPAPGRDLLAMLRANGMLPAGSTPVNGSLGSVLSPSGINTPPVLPTGLTRPALLNDAELTSTSLKRYDPLLLSPFCLFTDSC